ncbi:P-loop containing nucleoside triphosphate hydrolase protein [Mucor mucedo]|uniref:P-loop containing nucleoside triphosphate hydrolase protein n=1 Tax=Mucor mucedo TaxID=29922 RepID=UPI00222100FA|nr:P-loop containing nucleoside triphosphate hydrolase protein [Mucor mucedo]KAI7888252.1 P-loop containing nucleoside triphosphate hydrolase protein [Mucor mucedo]
MSQLVYSKLPQTTASLEHILKHFKAYSGKGPMMVGVSGCQGSGKTTLCETLTGLLKTAGYNVVHFSMDDLYLTRQDQIRLSNQYPHNPLYQQRGQAGSHDLLLAQETLEGLKKKEKGITLLPVYDKSKYGGMGDRLDKSVWKEAQAPLQMVLFEGWMLGFKPLLALPQEEKLSCSREDAEVMNEHLKAYEDLLYPYLDIFIHLSPKEREQVYQWRLEQEHHMKVSRGVEGLSDAQVKAFVDTYMPAYQLYLPRLDKVGFFGLGEQGEPKKDYEGPNRKDGGYNGSNKHLRIVLDSHRQVIQSLTIPP